MKKLILITSIMVLATISVSACGGDGNSQGSKGGYIVFQSSRPSATHWGGFKKWDVQTEMQGNKLSSVSFVVDLTSLYTEDDFTKQPKNLVTVQNFKQNDPKAKTDIKSFLTDHLIGEDFFNSSKYPIATFKSTKITTGTTPNTYSVTGLFTFMGKTINKTVTATVSKFQEKKFAIANFNVDQNNFPIQSHEYDHENIDPIVKVQVKISLPK